MIQNNDDKKINIMSASCACIVEVSNNAHR